MSLERIKTLNTVLVQFRIQQQTLQVERDKLFLEELTSAVYTTECLELHTVATRLYQKWAACMLAVHCFNPGIDTLATLESIPFLRVTRHLYGSIYDCDMSLFELAPFGGSSDGLKKYSWELDHRVDEVNEATLELWKEKRRESLELYTIEDFKNFNKRQICWRDKTLFESFRNLLTREGVASKKHLEARLGRRVREWELEQLKYNLLTGEVK